MEPYRGSFVGRDGELDAVARRLDGGARLVTLLGPGGVGKTRLLHRLLATHEEASFCFVDLTSARTSADAALAVARALGVGTAGADAEERVATTVAQRRRMLLALDNLEQLDGPDTRRMLSAWLAQAPALVVLATSRVRLNVAGEHVHRVEPLAPEAALRLFSDRAAAIGAPLGEGDTDVARRIVTVLEGMPLALELAASRLPVLGPDALLRHLERPLALAAPTTEPERHASIARVLEGSWALLDDRARAAAAAVGVFVGGFGVEAFAAITETGDDAVDVLGRLVDSSLVHRVAGPVVRHAPWEVVREYALERLAAEGRLDATRRRHAVWLATWARERLARLESGRDAEAAFAELLEEEANLVAAIRWGASASDPDAPALRLELVIALEPVRLLGGQLAGYADELADALRARGTGRALAARAHLAHARALAELGQPDAAARAYEEAIASARELGDPTLSALALAGKGRVLAGTGEWEAALRLFAAARAIDDASPRARALARATFEFYGAEVGVATDVIGAVTEYVDACRAVADRHELAFWLVQLARVESELARDRASAEAHIDEALAIARSIGDVRTEAFALFAAGAHELAFRSAREAVVTLDLAAHRLRETQRKRYEAWARGFLGVAQALASTNARDLAAAKANLDEAVTLATSVADAPRLAHHLAFRAAVRARLGDDAAEDDIARARAAMPAGSVYHAWTIDLCASTLDVVRNRPERARALLARAGWPEGGRDAAMGPRSWPWTIELYEPRIAMELADGALRARTTGTLLVATDGATVVLPTGQRLDLAAKTKLRRLVVALAEARAKGTTVPAEALLAAGWPGERMHATSAKNRLHVALDQLRKLGLRSLLVRGDTGWHLDPDVPFAWLSPTGN